MSTRMFQDAPYGELLRSAGLPLTVGYTGHLWDSAIGKYYAPFRYYNPQTARWNMRDPLGFVDGLNVYAYVQNSPIVYSDRLGLDRCIMSKYPKWKVWKILNQHYWIRVDVYKNGQVVGQVDLDHSPPPKEDMLDWYEWETSGEPIGVVQKHVKSNQEQDEKLRKEFISDVYSDNSFKPHYSPGACKPACYDYINCGIDN